MVYGVDAPREEITIDQTALEAIIAEAIMLAAWGGKLGCASQLWGGRAATPAGIERAMAKVRAEADLPVPVGETVKGVVS
jgi:hypothetical protein